jgi:aerobic-type carbon monoxide dehydrogenase small subunit (CoxS/CutS family)
MTEGKKKSKVSRRTFIKTMGTTVIAGSTIGRSVNNKSIVIAQDAVAFPDDKKYLQKITLKINNIMYRLEVQPRETLLDVIRNRLGFTGTKMGCNRGECGACTVVMDQKAVLSCSILAIQADSHPVITIEGVMKKGILHPVQQAIMQKDALQCGFCTPGQVMSLYALLLENNSPSEKEIEDALSGNLCRCGTYLQLKQAAQSL